MAINHLKSERGRYQELHEYITSSTDSDPCSVDVLRAGDEEDDTSDKMLIDILRSAHNFFIHSLEEDNTLDHVGGTDEVARDQKQKEKEKALKKKSDEEQEIEIEDEQTYCNAIAAFYDRCCQ